MEQAFYILPALFFLCPALLAFVAYPCFLLISGFNRRENASFSGNSLQSCSVILVVKNESHVIDRRLRNLLRQKPSSIVGEIIVVDDNSNDGTTERLESWAERDSKVRLVRSEGGGKATNINRAVALARYDILTFCDARQVFGSCSIYKLLESLLSKGADVAAGNLCYRSELKGIRKQDPLTVYWRLEKFIRRLESKTGLLVSISGAFYCARKTGFPNLPDQLILDDVFIPLRCVLAGGRVTWVDNAIAWDIGNRQMSSEYKRKRRTSAGVIQLVTYFPGLLRFWQSRVKFAFFCHKFIRLFIPLTTLVAILLCAIALLSLQMTFLFFVATTLVLAGLAIVRNRSDQLNSGRSVLAIFLGAVAGVLAALRPIVKKDFDRLWREDGDKSSDSDNIQHRDANNHP